MPNTECGLFEINILKDKETELMIEEVYVAIYSASEQAAPDTIIDASVSNFVTKEIHLSQKMRQLNPKK